MTLRTTHLPRALSRPSLVLGGERELILTSGIVTVGLGVIGMNPVSLAYAVIAFPLAVWGLRRLAKVDPMMSKVYLRQLKYQGYYPARSSVWRQD